MFTKSGTCYHRLEFGECGTDYPCYCQQNYRAFPALCKRVLGTVRRFLRKIAKRFWSKYVLATWYGWRNHRALWTALRLIREEVERHAPPGSVTSAEYLLPEPCREAEALIKGIRAIVDSK